MSKKMQTAFRVASIALVISVLGACNTDGVGPSEKRVVDELNFVEQDLVAVWSRFHRYDGSSEYIILRADRSWCEWEEPNGSDRKVDYRQGNGWSVDLADESDGTYTVAVPGYGIVWKYDYPDDELFPYGYRKNLTRHKTAARKTCDD